MLHSVIGVSDDIELGTALEEVIEECREKLDGHTPRVGILFSSCIDANFKDILFRIEKAFSGLQLIGCTTDGEITPRPVSLKIPSHCSSSAQMISSSVPP